MTIVLLYVAGAVAVGLLLAAAIVELTPRKPLRDPERETGEASKPCGNVYVLPTQREP